MKIGYPCLNRSLQCTPSSTFRVASYSKEKLIEKIKQNLRCLQKILSFNAAKGLLFFRISSDLVPLASHPVCRYRWQKYFKNDFFEIGKFIKKNKMRISMHPDQFVLINSFKKEVVKNSILELEYHREILELMQLDLKAKIQIHVGGVYKNKGLSMQRFVKNYSSLSKELKKRLVIENDHAFYSLADCLKINQAVGIPVLLDSFHHECFNQGQTLLQAVILAEKTWRQKDGCLMVDYSQQHQKKRFGSHAETINMRKFKKFITQIEGKKVDIMLEIKDKEKSALKAIGYIKKLNLLQEEAIGV